MWLRGCSLAARRACISIRSTRPRSPPRSGNAWASRRHGMKNSPEYVAHVLEMMRPTALATTRAMFGGHGVYVEGVIIAIVIDDVLYLKTDDENRAAFLDLGLEPFRCVTKEGDVHEMI